MGITKKYTVRWELPNGSISYHETDSYTEAVNLYNLTKGWYHNGTVKSVGFWESVRLG